jgi:glycosyltransferase involved in cell wall biosynthesis
MSPRQGSQAAISVFFPAYNDAESLRVLIPKTMETLRAITPDFEVIVIDDGSTDNTPDVVQRMQREFPALRVIRHPQNRGYGGALRSGFQAASKPLVFYTDGDGQYDVGELRDLLARLREGVDVVNGYKIRRADSLHRRLLGRSFHGLVRLLFGLRVRDVDCDFRLLRRHVLESVSLTFSSGAIGAELVTQIERAGFRIEEVPVHHYPRRNGKSQFFRPGPVARMAWDVFKLWMRLVLLRRRPNAEIGPRAHAPAPGTSNPRVSG